MLRLRDVVAALAVVVLTRLAYDDPSDSLSASIHLSYYVGREDAGSKGKLHRLALAPVVLDVDGDGSAEALASVLHDRQTNAWTLEVLDLKPAASTDKTHMAPFRPKILYQSSPVNFRSGLNMTDGVPLLPVQMVTGHVLLDSKKSPKDGAKPALSETHYGDTELNDRNRHYFCGTDWHDASDQCKTPCPKGTMSECPDGHQCFADTPCDIANFMAKGSSGDDVPNLSINDLLVTPAGGLPSIFTLWSNGVLAMHSLTGDFPADGAVKQSKVKELLGVRQMWEVGIVEDKSIVPYEWTSVSVTYVDATDASDKSGMVVVQAYLTHYSKDDDDELGEQFMVAFDAATGDKLWDASLNDDDEDAEAHEDPVLPVQAVVQSRARRRSLKPHVQNKKSHSIVSNCLHAYRRSLLTSGVMPYLYWGEADASSVAVHFEQQQHNQHAMHHKKKGKSSRSGNEQEANGKPQEAKPHSAWKRALTPFNRKKRAMHHRNQPKRGKPNVLVSKSDRGIQVRSLKNGRSVCHLSLWYDTLYTDLNHDGVLDGVFIATGDHLVQDDDKYELNEDAQWVAKLTRRLKEAKMLNDDGNENENKRNPFDSQYEKLCHLMAVSGIPAKEELFSVNLCGKSDRDLKGKEEGPPLAVEATYGRKGKDLIVALGDKTVQRIRGSNGRRMWQIHGKHHEDFPSWDDGYITMLDRIDAADVVPAARPVVLAGDSSIALISPIHGSVLATAAFPQPSIRRPVLVDFNGDGTTDIVVLTKEAVWGYRVSLRTGSSIVFRITVGLLVVGLMLAVLRNRFGPHPGSRSTDA